MEDSLTSEVARSGRYLGMETDNERNLTYTKFCCKP